MAGLGTWGAVAGGVGMSVSAGGAVGPLGEFVRVANQPAQEGDDVGVHVRADLGHGVLGALSEVIGWSRGDGPVAVLARHDWNLPIVACHPSSLPDMVVASHYDQEGR